MHPSILQLGPRLGQVSHRFQGKRSRSTSRICRPELAGQLTASHAGLIAVGEPTIEKALDEALASADKVVKRTVDATADEIASELQEALKG